MAKERISRLDGSTASGRRIREVAGGAVLF
jgi:hypothetical protein